MSTKEEEEALARKLARELGDAIEAEFAKPRPVILAEIQYTIPELVISGADVRQP